MGEQHGNVYVRNNSGGYRVVVRRDGTEKAVPWPVELIYATNGRIIATMSSTIGSPVQLWNGLDADMAYIGDIPRPLGVLSAYHATISPGGLLWIRTTISGVPKLAWWDTNGGSSWTYYPTSPLVLSRDPPPQYLFTDVENGVYYCWGPGTSSYPLRKYNQDTNVEALVSEPQIGISLWDDTIVDGTLVDGTILSVTSDVGGAGGNLFCAFRASTFSIYATDYSGILKLDADDGTVLDLFQFPGWDHILHQAAVCDSEGGLWALVGTGTTRALVRFDSDGTVLATINPAATIGNFHLYPGPRLGPDEEERTTGWRWSHQFGGSRWAWG